MVLVSLEAAAASEPVPKAVKRQRQAPADPAAGHFEPSDSEQPEAAAGGRKQRAAGIKRSSSGAIADRQTQRRRASSGSGYESMGDPIESSSADEAEAADGGDDFQPSESEAADANADEHSDSWQDNNDEEEDAGPRRLQTHVQPQRWSGRRSAQQRQAYEDAELEEEEEGRRPRRAAAAARPNYREQRSDDEAAEEEEEEEEASEAQHEEDEEQSSGSEDDAEEEEAPTRRPAARRSARGGGNRRTPEGVRRTGRQHSHVNYNLDAMEEDSENLQPSSSEDESEEEEGEGSDGPRRPTRRAAKAAGRAIRQQAGGGGKKRRKQPKRAAAPTKRLAVIDDSEDESEEASGPRRRRGRSASASASGSLSGSEEEGSEGEESGLASDLSGDDSHDVEEFDPSEADVERILWSRHAADGSGEEYRCKFKEHSYRLTAWLPYDVLVGDGRQQLVRNFQRKRERGEIDPYGDLEEGVHPDWMQVDRVIGRRTRNGRPQYLTKWRGLGYAESTWESEQALAQDQEHIERFQRFNQPSPEPEEQQQHELDATAVPDFLNGRQLRDYQLTSLQWMVANWHEERNCILGDEMGLGKTAQSISVLAYQRQFGGISGPFLVIAPLTTLGHWQREIETWTDMNCVVYAGGQDDRRVIEKYDLFHGPPGRGRIVKPNVVLSSYETVLKERSLFQNIGWQTVIIDEAHRMKSTGSSTRTVIAGMPVGWLLLLTGTPVQNNMRELYGILNLLDPEKFDDEEEFLEHYGDERSGMTPDQVRALQESLRPILLRRMKEDVETLPEKEEVIIWVELTPEQRAYYKAIYERQIGTLLAGASAKNMPNMRNLAMELRKVCCHPYLCNGLEEDIETRKAAAGHTASEQDLLVQASGKMLLLHKLLPKLRAEGHKVLIFSQFKIMLDVLEDFMHLAGYPCERIDGSTSSRDRQAAIDRFSKEGSEGFVFLLSTRAGGQGITLTAADTCIIYDSDWNPQNDLQAMARCHRIGQEKEVTIYRLVSKNTYEQNVFEISSRKYGLDEAILGNLGEAGSGNPEDDSRKIAQLLKHGAHCLSDLGAATEQSDAFAAEGIDAILQGRTEKRQIGGRAGNTFSVATFALGGSEDGSAGGDDSSYWATLLPGAAADFSARKKRAHAPVILAPRERKQVDYKGQLAGRFQRVDTSEDADYVAPSAADGDDDDDAFVAKGGKSKRDFRRWQNGELAGLYAKLVQLGPGRTTDVRAEAELESRTVEQVAELEAAVLKALPKAAKLVAVHEAQVAAASKAADAEKVPAAAATAAAGEGAAGGQGSPGKKRGPKKKERDSQFGDKLQRWMDENMADASPAVAHALRSKSFLEWASREPHKALQAIAQRKALAAWAAQAGAGGDLSPGSTRLGAPLPWVKPGKWPASWWREADTRQLLMAVNQLGWIHRKGNQRSELLTVLLTDKRFGFHERVRFKKSAAAPETAAGAAAAAGEGQPPEQAAQQGGQPMQLDAAAPKQELPQPGEAAAQPADGAGPAAGPGGPAAGPAGPGSPSKSRQLHVMGQEEWNKFRDKVADYVNMLLQALEMPRPAPAAKPKHVGGGAAAAAAAGGTKPSGAQRSPAGADGATPLSSGAGKGQGGSATAYTNPLTGEAGGSGSKAGKAAGGVRKPPLALQASEGKTKGKGGKMQQTIFGFLKPKTQQAQQAQQGASPGSKENQARPQSAEALPARQAQQAQQGEDDAIEILD